MRRRGGRKGSVHRPARMDVFEQEHSCRSVGTGPSDKVIRSEIEMVVHRARRQASREPHSRGRQTSAQIGVFGHAKLAVERAGRQDGLASDAQIAGDEIGACPDRNPSSCHLREQEWALARENRSKPALAAAEGNGSLPTRQPSRLPLPCARKCSSKSVEVTIVSSLIKRTYLPQARFIPRLRAAPAPLLFCRKYEN